MVSRILPVLMLVSLLVACGRDDPAKPPEKSYGARIGDAYHGVIDDAKQGVGDLNEQMQRTELATRPTIDR